MTIPGVDQNSQLMGKIIEATIYRSNDNEQWLRGNGRGAWLGNQDIELDLNDYIKDYKYYKVGIVVKSNDIDNYLNSDEVFTDIYDTTSSSEEVNNTLKDVLVQAGVDSVEKADADTLNKIYNEADETKKAEIAKALRDGLKKTDTATLRTAMQTNSDTRATVEAIEKMSGITVANDVSEDVKAYIDTANIKVLGAALNADDGVSNVGLKITKEADVATLDSKYKNAIPLGITLTNVSTAASGLAVPVTITIPVPMLMYSKEANNRKQEIDRQHHTIPNQRANDKHHGNVYNLLFRYGKVRSQNMEKLKSSFPTFCKRTFPQLHKIASYAHYAQCRLLRKPSHFIIYSRK